MHSKYRLPLLITLTSLIMVLTDCRKDDEYEYFEDYVGKWQFRVYRRSWNYFYIPVNVYDTIYSFGSISKLSDNRGLKIDYLGGSSVFVWVENDTILYEIGKIGIIRDNEIHFGYTMGTLPIGTSDQIYGIKKISPENLNESPSTVTSPATAVTLTGSMLRGIVNARSFSADVKFEYGITERYGNTIEGSPGKAECDMETHVKAYLSGLEPTTQYHFRTKVVSSAGTIYGDDMTFTTTGYSDPLTDIEGNVYETIQIGNQVWMAENLRSSKYNNGDTIPYLKINPAVNKDVYGALYNFYAVDDERNLCPSGWHVPDAEEWSALLTTLYPNSGGRLKESGLAHWINPNQGADNSSGFTALPGGRWYGGDFSLIGEYGFWWSTKKSSDHAFFLTLFSAYDKGWVDFGSKEQFISVRCLKD